MVTVAAAAIAATVTFAPSAAAAAPTHNCPNAEFGTHPGLVWVGKIRTSIRPNYLQGQQSPSAVCRNPVDAVVATGMTWFLDSYEQGMPLRNEGPFPVSTPTYNFGTWFETFKVGRKTGAHWPVSVTAVSAVTWAGFNHATVAYVFDSPTPGAPRQI